MENFEAFLYTTRQEASKAYICQDSSLVDALFAKDGTATLFDSVAGVASDPASIRRVNQKSVSQLGLYSKIELDVKNQWTSGDLGFWSGFERIEFEEDDKIVKLTHRVTEIYKNVDQQWKLIHRHTSEASRLVLHPV